MEELTAALAARDAKSMTLKAQMAQRVAEGPSSAKLSRLKEEKNRLALEVKSLTQQLLQAHQDCNARMTFLFQSLAPKPSGPSLFFSLLLPFIVVRELILACSVILFCCELNTSLCNLTSTKCISLSFSYASMVLFVL